MIALGIETSCDETSAALVKDGNIVLSNIVASSLKLHSRYKGIIPEIASRSHVEYISFVIEEAICKASKKLKDIDIICVTKGPGLVGSLLVGVSFAKAMSFALKKPVIGVNHLEAHLYAPFLSTEDKSGIKHRKPPVPFVGLVVSGGHTSLFLVKKDFNFKLISSTSDDAVGETFDKVAKILGLGYPGGPFIERMANRSDTKKVQFSCKGGSELGFSFSGIKTAVLYKVNDLNLSSDLVFRKAKTSNEIKSRKIKKQDIAGAFQRAVVDALIEKSLLACKINNVSALVIGGGVAVNNYLRFRFEQEVPQQKVKVYFPQKGLSLDNAAMIAGRGYWLYARGEKSDDYLVVDPGPVRNIRLKT